MKLAPYDSQNSTTSHQTCIYQPILTFENSLAYQLYQLISSRQVSCVATAPSHSQVKMLTHTFSASSASCLIAGILSDSPFWHFSKASLNLLAFSGLAKRKANNSFCCSTWWHVSTSQRVNPVHDEGHVTWHTYTIPPRTRGREYMQRGYTRVYALRLNLNPTLPVSGSSLQSGVK